MNQGSDSSNIDEGLMRLERYAPEFAGFLSNHGPMGIEALSRLGREAAIPEWVAWYEPRLENRWSGRRPITAQDWRDALGDRSRYADWVEFFNRQLAEASWKQVVAEWASKLAAGLSGSATHGLIRTGHALRSLAQNDTPERQRELCSALAYWGASYRALPEAHSESRLTIEGAVQVLPLLPEDQQAQRDWDSKVSALTEFAPIIDLVELNDVPQSLSLLTKTFAGLYLANAGLPRRVIIPIHAVTSAAAVRNLVPYVTPVTAHALVRYVWQAGAAITVGHAVHREPVGVDSAGDWDDLIDRAVAGRDEHAIKFVEACRNEFKLTAEPIFFAAASDAVARLS